jgi:predicted DNA-binding transcriptional regulator YafY
MAAGAVQSATSGLSRWAFFDRVCIVVAWCEFRTGFRHFRTDRIGKVQVLDKRYPRRRQVLLKEWRASEGIAER